MYANSSVLDVITDRFFVIFITACGLDLRCEECNQFMRAPGNQFPRNHHSIGQETRSLGPKRN